MKRTQIIPACSERTRSRLAVILGIVLVLPNLTVGGADRAERVWERQFAETVQPFLEAYCVSCHGAEKQKGKLDLRFHATPAGMAKGYRHWEGILERLQVAAMPPEEAERQPAAELRQRVVDWIQQMRRNEARRNAGDPGPVLAHRLSNAEFNYTIRDLIGVDLRPAREFPVDPANEAGFDNSGESLTMSPALVTKHLEAARSVAEHLVLKPKGFAFAPHPVVTDTDRDRYCVQRIIDFYQRQPTNYADYFMAAWRFRHRAAFRQPKVTLAEFAAAEKVSAKYLATIWAVLSESRDDAGPLAVLRAMWRDLPTPTPTLTPAPALAEAEAEGRAGVVHAARTGCVRMSDYVGGARERLRPEVTNLAVRGVAAGSQPLVLWKNQQMAANRLRYNPGQLTPSNRVSLNLGSDRTEHEAAMARFCRVFPDAFYVSERVLVFLKEDKDSRGRLLSAGFHLMTGYFRDDAPLSELILEPSAQRELDALWEEFHFITLDFVRQYKDFIFFERAEPPRFAQGAEFDFARSEDKDATSEAKIRRFGEAYLAKVRGNGADAAALQAVEGYFKNISAEIQQVERARKAAEPSHLQALMALAERAYRRPISRGESDDLLAFYRGLRERDGLDHEAAVRDVVTSVLLAPEFCFRVNPDVGVGVGGSENRARPSRRGASPGAVRVEALSDYALASRLSYFLWSSLPDAELLAHAKMGDLHRPRVITAQARRMLKDERVRGLATEFGGNWLDFRPFETHNAVDRQRFAAFNDELRAAMYEEPIRFMLELVQKDRSVLDSLFGDYTFVNPVLARHYGIPERPGAPNEWRMVSEASRYQRGGLLPMAVFLTKNAPGLRTSPVKRGYWVARRLLGERIPPPPPTVPELPNDETKLGELTLRETLVRHRADPSCAGCHARFDGLGLVFEGFGPIGETRTQDLAGRPVDTHANFPGGGEGVGVDGLRRYLHERRQAEFLENLCRKLLSYALGRTLLISDDALVARMRSELAGRGYRFGVLVDAIVTSPQFLNRRIDEPLGDR